MIPDTASSDEQVPESKLTSTTVPDSVYDPETAHADDDDVAAMFHEKVLPEITTSAVVPRADPQYVPDGIVDDDEASLGGGGAPPSQVNSTFSGQLAMSFLHSMISDGDSLDTTAVPRMHAAVPEPLDTGPQESKLLPAL